MNEIEIDIKLDTIKKVKSFIEAVTKYNDDITVKSYRYDIDAKGLLDAVDLRQFAGDDFTGYIDAKGSLPMTLTVNGNMKRQNMVLRVLTSPEA